MTRSFPRRPRRGRPPRTIAEIRRLRCLLELLLAAALLASFSSPRPLQATQAAPRSHGDAHAVRASEPPQEGTEERGAAADAEGGDEVSFPPDPSFLGELPWRAVGPTATGGRIVDIAVPTGDPDTIYAASASGGLWKTVNRGTTWKCIFENEGTISIGDVAVDPTDARRLWIGTGEANNQRSSYWGDGVYRSDDAGQTWLHTGLAETHHIGRIVVDPRDSNTVFVAALGHLYSANPERGLYKTSDAGETWRKVLDTGDRVGAVDVLLDPDDPDTLYVATYERLRRAWHFDGAGPGSGIWRSRDGGESWVRLTAGLPEGEIGRIGLAAGAAGTGLIFACVSNQNPAPPRPDEVSLPGAGIFDALGFRVVTEEEGARVASLRRGSAAARLGVRLDDLLVEIAGADVRDAARRKRAMAGLRAGDRVRLAFQRGEEEKLRHLEVRLPRPRPRQVGGEVYRSDDDGDSWVKCNEEPVGGSPAYYYGQIRVDPGDADRLYLLGVPLFVSEDGGKTWRSDGARSVHVDHHALWIDPEDSDHIYLGNDGGFHISYDRARTWDHVYNLPLAQFYAIGVDMQQPYHIYGGTQDNGSHGGPSRSRSFAGVGRFDWYRVGGGDGFYVQVPSDDANTIYSESQFGWIARLDRRTGERRSIRPQASDPEGVSDRYNWNSPILISHHDTSTIYFAANRLFKSFNRGDDWLAVSPDLTTRDPERIAGNVPHCTITTIAESPFDRDLLLIGTDDGLVQRTRDGGKSWQDLSSRFPLRPANWWVSRVELSSHDRKRAYVAMTGYREDDFRPFLFASDDGGESWRSIAEGLPDVGPVNVIREDPHNADLLFVGTELGAFASLDGGGHWFELGVGLPTIAVHDLVVHPREREVVLGTHGRGAFVLDVAALEAITRRRLEQSVALLPVRDVVLLDRTWGGALSGDRKALAPNPPEGALVAYTLTESIAEGVELSLHVEEAGGKRIAELKATTGIGLHQVRWDCRRGRVRVAPGRYRVVLGLGEERWSEEFEVRPDPRRDASSR